MSEKKRVYVETENIDNVLKEMNDYCDEIRKELDVSLEKINQTKEVFDTPASKYFREKAEEYINEEKLYINNSILPVVDILVELSKMYNEDYDYEKESLSLEDKKEGNS